MLIGKGHDCLLGKVCTITARCVETRNCVIKSSSIATFCEVEIGGVHSHVCAIPKRKVCSDKIVLSVD